MAPGRFIGRHVVIARPPHRARPLVDRLRAAGARVTLVPAIHLAPADPAALRRALNELEAPAWLVFTSVPAVEACLRTVPATRWPGFCQVAAVGPGTARALERCGRRPDLVPQLASAAGLLADPAFDRDLEGTSILLPISDRARPELAEGLRARKARVQAVVAYHNVPIESIPSPLAAELAERPIDAAVFASPSAVRAVFTMAGSQGWESTLRRSAAISIGPTTSAALRQVGVRVAAEAETPSDQGFWSALCQALPPADPSS